MLPNGFALELEIKTYVFNLPVLWVGFCYFEQKSLPQFLFL